jgi:hypothetical protein
MRCWQNGSPKNETDFFHIFRRLRKTPSKPAPQTNSAHADGSGVLVKLNSIKLFKLLP